MDAVDIVTAAPEHALQRLHEAKSALRLTTAGTAGRASGANAATFRSLIETIRGTTTTNGRAGVVVTAQHVAANKQATLWIRT